MNLEGTLFEAEGHHYKSLAIAISGFSHHRVDLQSDPNQVGNGGVGKGEGVR